MFISMKSLRTISKLCSSTLKFTLVSVRQLEATPTWYQFKTKFWFEVFGTSMSYQKGLQTSMEVILRSLSLKRDFCPLHQQRFEAGSSLNSWPGGVVMIQCVQLILTVGCCFLGPQIECLDFPHCALSA